MEVFQKDRIYCIPFSDGSVLTIDKEKLLHLTKGKLATFEDGCSQKEYFLITNDKITIRSITAEDEIKYSVIDCEVENAINEIEHLLQTDNLEDLSLYKDFFDLKRKKMFKMDLSLLEPFVVVLSGALDNENEDKFKRF